MGITGLWNTVSSTGKQESLMGYLSQQKYVRKNAKDATPIRVGVDISPLMAECIGAASAPSVNGRWAGGEIYILFNKLARLLHSPATFIFVFDGPERPSEKRGVKVILKEPHWVKRAKELIGYFGYYIHQAPGEAEAELAMLSTFGLIDAVMTSDGDALVFGAQTLLRNVPRQAKNVDDDIAIFTAGNLASIGLTRGGLILFALLGGGDYHAGVKGCGAATAHALARAGFGDQLIEAIDTLGNEDFILFLNTWRVSIRSELIHNHAGFLNSRQPHIAPLITDSFPNLAILNLYHQPVTSRSSPTNSTPDARIWITKEPDLHGLTLFCSQVFDWDTESKLKSGFSKHVWAGTFIQMIYSKYMLYDDKRKLLATPTMQAEVRKLGFLERKGKYAGGGMMGEGKQARLRVSAANFVRLMSASFSPEPTDVVMVWLPRSLIPDPLQTSPEFDLDATAKRQGKRSHAAEPVSKYREKHRITDKSSFSHNQDDKQPIKEKQAVRSLGFFDWTDLDNEGPSHIQPKEEQHRNTGKRFSEVIDLTGDDSDEGEQHRNTEKRCSEVIDLTGEE